MQILVAEASREYTEFGLQGIGFYQFKWMSFDLVNSPKTFFRLIDALFCPEFDPKDFSFLDDKRKYCINKPVLDMSSLKNFKTLGKFWACLVCTLGSSKIRQK